jgi:hypothetical protein
MRVQILGLFLLLISFIGCKEVKITDGRVPAEYLSQAKQIEGRYYGTFDGKRAEIQIYFQGDRPFIKYSDAYGNDILDTGCNSKINLLQKIVVSKEDGQYVLDNATFAFHPGSCRLVEGRTLDLKFSGRNKFNASIYEHMDYVQRCNPGGPPNYGNNCYLEQVPRYITGRFNR